LLRLARPYSFRLGSLFALELLDSVFVLLTPLPLKIAIDSVLGSRPLPPLIGRFVPEQLTESTTTVLYLAIGLLFGIAFFDSLQSFASSLLKNYIGEKILLDFRAHMFRHAQRLSLAYHDSAGTSDAQYRIQKDAGAIQDLLIDDALAVVGAAVTIVLMFSVTIWLDWQLAIIAAVIAPVLLLLSARFRGPLRQQARELKKIDSGSVAVVHEVLANLRVVKAFGAEDRERDRYISRSMEALRARIRLSMASGSYGKFIRMVTVSGKAAVLYIGVTHVQSGVLTLGSLVLVLNYLQKLYDPLKTLSRKAGTVQNHLASAERAFALLDQRPDVDDRPNAQPLERAAGALEFRSVSFRYGKGRPVLDDVSFTIEPGTRLGIVGATGAGKSTLLNLLTRFYDPSAGQVSLDGADIRDIRLTDLRNQYALVLQDAVLFSATIAENIAYARTDATREEIVAAARAACAHDFIESLPFAYDTRVGERGMTLSGGERQRIAIARAFLKDAPILLMDEPTSAVDIQTETDILAAMERLMLGRTCIIITHRLSPLSVCDSVLALEQGRLVDPNVRTEGLRIAAGSEQGAL
jgi:ATP-binding cassette subfamily B protein